MVRKNTQKSKIREEKSKSNRIIPFRVKNTLIFLIRGIKRVFFPSSHTLFFYPFQKGVFFNHDNNIKVLYFLQTSCLLRNTLLGYFYNSMLKTVFTLFRRYIMNIYVFTVFLKFLQSGWFLLRSMIDQHGSKFNLILKFLHRVKFLPRSNLIVFKRLISKTKFLHISQFLQESMLIVFFMFLLFPLLSYSDSYQFDRNPDGTYKAIYVISDKAVSETVIPEIWPDGKYKAIYIRPIDGITRSDTFISISDENSIIRYNRSTDKWEYTNDGINWIEFGTGGSGEGDMLKATYDTNNNGIVDNAESVVDNSITSAKIQDGTITETDLSFSPVEVGDNVSLLNNDAGYLTNESDPIWSSEKSNYFNKTTDTTDNITEGSTNKFYSTSLFNADFADKSIGDLSDVEITSPSDGEVLKYDAVSGKFKNGTVSGGGGIGGAGTANYIAKFSDADTLETGLISDNGTTVNIEGDLNIASGKYLKYNNVNFAMAQTSLDNYFSGHAGNLTMTGDSNTGFGSLSLSSNSEGIGNTAFGCGALAANTKGFTNTAIGYCALSSNSTGENCVAVGAHALSSNTSSANTAVGKCALSSNTSGTYNTAVGFYALVSNTTEYNNTAVGAFCLKSTTGQRNTAVGESAGFYSTTGISNVFIGTECAIGTSEYTGANYNVIIGDRAGHSITNSQSGCVFIGYHAGYYETGSNKLYIANSETDPPLIYGDFSTGRIGIGTKKPLASIHLADGIQVDTGKYICFGAVHGSDGYGIRDNSGVIEIKNSGSSWNKVPNVLNDLSDVDISSPSNGEVLKYDSATGKFKNGTISGGVTTFLDLTDTPSSYSGNGGKVLMVKSTEDGVEFGSLSGGGQTLYDCVVATDGSGDYTSIKNAINSGAKTIFIKDGTYNETQVDLGYGEITFIGESKKALWTIGSGGYLFKVHDTVVDSGDGSSKGVTYSAGSLTITGNNTSWTSTVQPGDYLKITGSVEGAHFFYYEIASVDSDTQLTLKTPILEPSAEWEPLAYEIHRTTSKVKFLNMSIEGKFVNYGTHAVIIDWEFIGCEVKNGFQSSGDYFDGEKSQDVKYINCNLNSFNAHTGRKGLIKGCRINLGADLGLGSYTTFENNVVECGSHKVVISGDFITIKGNIFVGVYDSMEGYYQGNGIDMNGNSVGGVIANNTFQELNIPITLDNLAESYVISGNIMNNIGGNGISAKMANGVVTNNVLSHVCQGWEGGPAALYVESSGNVVIANNTVIESSMEGIHLYSHNGDDALIGNLVKNTCDSGIRVEGQRISICKNNQMINCNSSSEYYMKLPETISIGSSPWTYHNTSNDTEEIMVSGGTVSSIEFSRDNSNWYDTGLTSGCFTLRLGDYLKITYTEAPTVVRVIK